MKICIIGASGAGKSTFASQLSKQTGVESFALDELFWDNSEGHYNARRDPRKRDRLLHDLLQKENWIMEGVQYAWVGDAFEQADRIYLLDPPAWLCRVRIVRRYFARKLLKNGRSKENLRSLLALLRWTKHFYRKNLPEIRVLLDHYPAKVTLIKNKREASEALTKSAHPCS